MSDHELKSPPFEDCLGLRDLFPDFILVCSTRMSNDVSDLYPEEEALVAAAILKRRREFAHGRRMARQLLSALGFPAAAIPTDQHRAPLWPAGVVASISHDRALCGVVATKQPGVEGVGLDIEESVRELSGESLVATGEELAWAAGVRGVLKEIDPVLLVFSAKEAVYKAIYPRVRRFVDFHEVTVSFDLACRTFTVRWGAPLAAEIGDSLLHGAFKLADGKVVTGALLLGADLRARR